MAWLCPIAVLGAAALADEHLPTVTIAYSGATGAYEHEGVTFTLTRTGDAAASLDIFVDVTETGDMVGATGEGRQTVTFAAGDETTSFVPEITNDGIDESHSSVTVTLDADANADFLVGEPNAASVLVRDDDGDLIELTLDPLDLTVEEGGLTAIELVATVVDDGTASTAEDLVRLFGNTVFYVSWTTWSIEAESLEDFPPLSETQDVAFDQFNLEDDRLLARIVLPALRVLENGTDEPDERFTMRLEPAPGLDRRISLVPRSEFHGLDPGVFGVKHLGTLVTVPGDDGRLRLVNGAVDHEGRLEMLYDGQWGTICDDYWTDEDSEVACRQLGYPGAETNTGRFLRAHFGEGTGPIWLDDVLCAGDEDRLIRCPRCCGDDPPAIGEHNCKHAEDVGVRCLLEERPPAGPCGSQSANCGDNARQAKSLSIPIQANAEEQRSFDASDHGLTDLIGLGTFNGLRRLDLAHNRLTDLSALAALGELRWLDLADNDIADLAPLAQLADLRYLNLAGNRVTDLSPLVALHRLQMLVLDDNEVVDLGPLTNLTELRQLFVVGNHVEDLSPLTHMAALERIDLFANPITDLAVLDNLENLVWSRLPVGTSPDAEVSASEGFGLGGFRPRTHTISDPKVTSR